MADQPVNPQHSYGTENSSRQYGGMGRVFAVSAALITTLTVLNQGPRFIDASTAQQYPETNSSAVFKLTAATLPSASRNPQPRIVQTLPQNDALGDGRGQVYALDATAIPSQGVTSLIPVAAEYRYGVDNGRAEDSQTGSSRFFVRSSSIPKATLTPFSDVILTAPQFDPAANGYGSVFFLDASMLPSLATAPTPVAPEYRYGVHAGVEQQPYLLTWKSPPASLPVSPVASTVLTSAETPQQAPSWFNVTSASLPNSISVTRAFAITQDELPDPGSVQSFRAPPTSITPPATFQVRPWLLSWPQFPDERPSVVFHVKVEQFQSPPNRPTLFASVEQPLPGYTQVWRAPPPPVNAPLNRPTILTAPQFPEDRPSAVYATFITGFQRPPNRPVIFGSQEYQEPPHGEVWGPPIVPTPATIAVTRAFCITQDEYPEQGYTFRTSSVLLAHGPGFLVQAVTAGWYNGIYWQPGDVFMLNDAIDYISYQFNYGMNSGTQQFGWMMKVPPNTPLMEQSSTSFQPIPLYPIIDPIPPKRTVY